jgi:hypothetical protein
VIFVVIDGLETIVTGICLDTTYGYAMPEGDGIIIVGMEYAIFALGCWIYLYWKEGKVYNPFTRRSAPRLLGALTDNVGMVFYSYAMAMNSVSTIRFLLPIRACHDRRPPDHEGKGQRGLVCFPARNRRGKYHGDCRYGILNSSVFPRFHMPDSSFCDSVVKNGFDNLEHPLDNRHSPCIIKTKGQGIRCYSRRIKKSERKYRPCSTS